MKRGIMQGVFVVLIMMSSAQMRAVSMQESIEDFGRVLARWQSAGQQTEFVDRLNHFLFKIGAGCAAVRAGITGAALAVWVVMRDFQQ